MSTMKAISAAVILSAAVAAPAFAQEVYGPAVGYAGPPVVYRYYGPVPGNYPPESSDQYWNLVNHGFTGRDPSRVGGDSPSVKPSGS